METTRAITTPLYRPCRHVTGAVIFLAVIALAAGCSTSSASDNADAPNSSKSGTAWTTISLSITMASTGANISNILRVNASVEDTLSSVGDIGIPDTSSAITIILSGSSTSASGSASGNVKVGEGTITVNGSGTYIISDELSNGRIVTNAPKVDVRLILKDASITNSDGPAIGIQDAGNVIVVLVKDSKNALTGGASYASGQEAIAALLSSDTSTITGTSRLGVIGPYKDDIFLKNDLIVTGNTTITVKATDDGLRGRDYLVVELKALATKTGGDILKSNESSDETKGFTSPDKASIMLTSTDDVISATTDVTVESTTLMVAADSGQTGTTVEGQAPPGQGLTADSLTPSPKSISAGVSYMQGPGKITVNAADKSLQVPFVSVSGGELSIAAGDDNISASNGDHVIEGHEDTDSESDNGLVLIINGDEVEISHASPDGIDSSGSVYIEGGIVVVSGQAGTMDGLVDTSDENQLAGVTGSPLVSAGDMLTVTDTSGSQVASSKVDFITEAITMLGLTEGQQYTVATSSGDLATGVVSALSAGMGGPMGDDTGGQGDQGGQPNGGQGQQPDGGQQSDNQNSQSSSQSSITQNS